MIGIRKALREYREQKILSGGEAITKVFKNRNLPVTWVSKDQWQKRKKSDTLFIFGSGPSINQLTPYQWEIIKRHDSMGLNFSFLTHYPTTYFYLGYEPSSKQSIRDTFSLKTRKLFENSLWFLPTKVLLRLVHPLTIPEFFPLNPKVAVFNFPNAIQLESDRPFRVEDFEKSLIYRGVMCVGLHLASLLGYRHIVLLGVDLQTHKHFFDDHEVMRRERQAYNHKMAPNKVFESMIPKTNKYRTMEEYYYALNELYFQPRRVQLYVGNQGNMLCPRIPFYGEF
ncbi:MAG: hypothetical protein EXS63_07615 [Candidatus Omnitrophica bacterium]|nr:hypothetical protein [Candidatus Omnitrophota bacterium]